MDHEKKIHDYLMEDANSNASTKTRKWINSILKNPNLKKTNLNMDFWGLLLVSEVTLGDMEELELKQDRN